MIVNDDYPIEILEKELLRRKSKNRNYSLRAFAKDLGIDSSNLSAILRRKRGVPHNKAQELVQKLALRPLEKQLFLQSTQRRKFRSTTVFGEQEQKKILSEELHYSLLSEWEYFAVLNIIELDNPPQDNSQIAKRLNIPLNRVETVVKNLIGFGFVEFSKSEGFSRLAKKLDTSDDVESSALKQGNREALELCIEAIDLPVEERDFGIVTFGFDPDRMDEFKGIIREFQDRISQFSEQGHKKEVYQFTTQLIPISKCFKENV